MRLSKLKLKRILYGISSIFFIGCGGTSQHEPREIKTLYFRGSATNGIDYQCGERRGVSKTSNDKHGSITCVYAPIKFYLGSLYLGEVTNITNQQNIYPQTLVSSFDGDFNNPELLKLTILLQSLNDNPNGNHMNISKGTKDKITLTTLKYLTIKQLNQEIEKMGFTPIPQEEAKINLILNSENTNIGKPTILPFEEDISTNLMVGSTIGQLTIDSGDGTLHHPFLLQGRGAKKFFLNNNGKLILTQSLELEDEYNLTVTATNEYGYTTQTIKIHAIDANKIGKAQMGRLKGATVELFKLNRDGSRVLVGTTTTKTTGNLNQIGNFDLMTNLMDDHQFYIYEITGGVDIDSDNNGIQDSNPTPNQGVMHLITKGIWVKNAMQKIRITPLSEILYIYTTKSMESEASAPKKSLKAFNYSQLEEQLNHHATLLLKSSLDSDQAINAQDITFFDPINNQNTLSDTLTYNHTYQTITNKIRANDPSYKSDIFSAYIVDSFQSNAIEIVGSTIYTIDMMKSGEFRIYDLETKKLIGKLKLPNTPVEEDSHVIYVNLLDKDIWINSLTEWTYSIGIKDYKKPLLVENPFMKNSSLSGNFNHVAIGKSYNQNIFSKEREVYFYSKKLDLKNFQIVSFFKTTIEEKIYQYQFSSNLKNISSLWAYKTYLYIIGDNKIHIFQEKNQKMEFASKYEKQSIKGDILGIEEDILYILDKKELTLLDISNPLEPKFIERFSVPFSYKLGIKTNGNYITTGSKIISIQALRASKNAN